MPLIKSNVISVLMQNNDVGGGMVHVICRMVRRKIFSYIKVGIEFQMDMVYVLGLHTIQSLFLNSDGQMTKR